MNTCRATISDDRDGDDEQAEDRDLRARDLDEPGVREDLRRVRLERPVEQLDDVLEDERHADRGDQRRQARCAAERFVGEALDEHAEQAEDAHREQERGGQDDDQRPTSVIAPEKPRKQEVRLTKAPTMNMSPWAKLMSSMIP